MHVFSLILTKNESTKTHGYKPSGFCNSTQRPMHAALHDVVENEAGS